MRHLTRDAGGLYRLALAAKEAAVLKELHVAAVRLRDKRDAPTPSAIAKREMRAAQLAADLEEKFAEVEAAINNAYPELLG